MGRPKENRQQLRINVSPETPKNLRKIALQMGFTYGGDGATGKFLDTLTQCKIQKLGEETIIIFPKKVDTPE